MTYRSNFTSHNYNASVIIPLIFVILLGFCGCSADNGEPTTNFQNIIVGTWRYQSFEDVDCQTGEQESNPASQEEIKVFRSNGTYEFITNGTVVRSGRWEISADSGYLLRNGETGPLVSYNFNFPMANRMQWIQSSCPGSSPYFNSRIYQRE